MTATTMKLFLAQRNFTVGDFDGNRELILAALDAGMSGR